MNKGGPSEASRGSADSRSPVMASHELISHQPASVSPTLRPLTLASGKLPLECAAAVQKAGCRPLQVTQAEPQGGAKVLLSQNNGCLSGLPLITVTLDVQTSALLWSSKCKSRASCSHLEVRLHVEQ